MKLYSETRPTIRSMSVEIQSQQQSRPEPTLRRDDVLQNSLHEKHGVSFKQISSVQRSMLWGSASLCCQYKRSSEEQSKDGEGRRKRGQDRL